MRSGLRTIKPDVKLMCRSQFEIFKIVSFKYFDFSGQRFRSDDVFNFIEVIATFMTGGYSSAFLVQATPKELAPRPDTRPTAIQTADVFQRRIYISNSVFL